MDSDLDGLGIVVGFATRTLHMAQTDYYQAFHRMYGHGIAGALVIAAVAAIAAGRRKAVFLWSLVAVHLHYLCEEGELRRVESGGLIRYVRTQ